MTPLIIDAVFNADTHTKIKDIAYSTSPRDVITISDCMKHYDRTK